MNIINRIPKFNQELNKLFREYANRPSLLYFAENMTRDFGRSQSLSETGGFKSYRRPQDQQCAGTGSFGEADGKNQIDCRNRRRTARSGHSHGGSPDGNGM